MNRPHRASALTAGIAALLMALPGAAQTLRIERALPVVGQPITLQVRPGTEPLAEGTVAEFVVRDGSGAQTPVANDGALSARWAPTAPGPYEVIASIAGQALAPVSVFAVQRPLFFSYWECPPTQRYVTAVMENTPEDARAQQWLDRGVLPLQWKPGAIEGHTKPEEWADDYTNVLPGRAGITIDEFWGAGAPPHRDEAASEGLLMARRRAPGIFQAPYCLTVERDKVREAFGQADLLQVELYRRDFRGYEGMENALRRFADAGLGDRAIPILAAGPGNALWITTERELREQVAFVRWAVPDAPGVGFFPGFYPGLAEAADRAIYDYFLRPALLVRDGWLRNIGQLTATRVRVTLPDGTEKEIGTLFSGQRVAVGDGARCVPGADYTVVEWAPPTSRPSPDAAATAEQRAFEAAVLGAAPKMAIAPDALSLTRATSDEADVNGQISGATVALGRALSGQPIGLSVSMMLRRTGYYGIAGCWLQGAGGGRLGFSISRGDHDRDLPGTNPRAEFAVWSDAKTPVADTCPLGLEPGVAYRLFVGHDGASTARMALWGPGDALLWTSGPIPLAGPIRVDTLQFEVKPFDGSDVRLEPEGLLLRGVSGGEKPSPYVIEALLSGITVSQ